MSKRILIESKRSLSCWAVAATVFVSLMETACTATARAQPVSATPLEVHFIDVGTGDCIWIRTGDDGINGNGTLEGYNIIIDGGDWGRGGRIDGYAFASAYFQEGVNGSARLPLGARIEWMILTHPHSDHNGGLWGILNDYQVANILDPGHDKKNDEGELDRERPGSAYGRFFAKASTEVLDDGTKATYHWGVPATLTLNWGSELSANVLWSSRTIVGHDLNNTSIVLRLGFTGPGQDASFLFMGDAEEFVEKRLVHDLGTQLATKVLKAGHHGSNSSSTIEFLNAVLPAHVVISSGNHEFSDVMLPRLETFDRISQVSQAHGLNTKVWRTDRDDKTPVVKEVGAEGGDDTIVARTDGTNIDINYVGQSAIPAFVPTQCQATTAQGTQCKRKPASSSQFCWQHSN